MYSYPPNLLQDVTIDKDLAKKRVGKAIVRLIKSFENLKPEITKDKGISIIPTADFKKGALIFGSEKDIATEEELENTEMAVTP